MSRPDYFQAFDTYVSLVSQTEAYEIQHIAFDLGFRQDKIKIFKPRIVSERNIFHTDISISYHTLQPERSWMDLVKEIAAGRARRLMTLVPIQPHADLASEPSMTFPNLTLRERPFHCFHLNILDIYFICRHTHIL